MFFRYFIYYFFQVHNIVLYPEKKSWCQITPIQQIVASPGYESVTIDNNVCVGACYSYSIPKTQPAEPGELIGPYCDSCQPSEMKCYHVNLQRSENTIDGPKLMRKNVQIITNCSCQACDKIRKDDCEIMDENTSVLPQNLFTEQKNSNKSYEDVPELLDVNNISSDYNENQIKLKNKLKKWFEVSLQNDTDQIKNEDNYAKFSNELKNFSADLKNEDTLKVDSSEEYDTNDIIVEDITDPFVSKLEAPLKHPAYKHHTMKKNGVIVHNHHLGDEEVMGKLSNKLCHHI